MFVFRKPDEASVPGSEQPLQMELTLITNRFDGVVGTRV